MTPLLHPLAAYLRDSGGDRQDLSIDQQRQAIERWAVQNAATITTWFTDAARPGSSTVGRDQFQALMRHFRDHPVEEGIVMWKMSRFAREIDDAQFYKADLRRRGYKIISIADNIPDGPEGRFFEAAIDWMNQRFLDDLSEDVTRGLRSLVENYGAIPGTPPKGLKTEPVTIGSRRNGQPHIAHRWVIDPLTAPLVLQAFQLRAAGHPLAHINEVTHLFKSLNSYTTFFQNQIYIGILQFGELTLPDYLPPIVPLETWTAVQAITKAHARHANLRQPGDRRNPQRQASRYLLSGLLICAACGSPMNGLTVKPAGSPTYDRYICSAAKRRRDCTAPAVPAKILDNAVLDNVIQHMLNPEMMAQAMHTINDQIQESTLTHRHHRHELTTRLAGLRKRISNLTEAIADGAYNRSIRQKLDDLELEENEILAKINTLDALMRQQPIDLDPEQIRRRSDQLRALLASKELPEVQRFLRGIIQQITIHRHANTITGQILYHSPVELPPNKSPPDDIITSSTGSMPPSLTSLGAPVGRHTFTAHITATMRSYRKKQP